MPSAIEWLRVWAGTFTLIIVKGCRVICLFVNFGSHSNRHYFVSVVEVNSIFPLDLNIFIFIAALHKIVPPIFEKMRRNK